MRTFAKKPKATQQTTSAKSTIPSRSLPRQNRDIHPILHLQRTIGNQTVQRLLHSKTEDLEASSAINTSTRFALDFSQIPVHANADSNLQPKLKVNAPGDKYEQEADQVMRMPEPQLQRTCPCGSRCHRCKPKQPCQEHERLADEDAADRMAARAMLIGYGIERPPVQGKRTMLSPVAIEALRPTFGPAVGRVHLHRGPSVDQMADNLGARAFSVGEDVYLPRAEASNETSLVAHELAHRVLRPEHRDRLVTKNRSADLQSSFGYFATKKAALGALQFLSGLSAQDFEDTVAAMAKSGNIARLLMTLQDRKHLVRFLRVLGANASHTTKVAVFDAFSHGPPGKRVSFFDLWPGYSLVAFGNTDVAKLGVAGPTASSAQRGSVISSDPTKPFTGSGATGALPSSSPMSLLEMKEMRSQGKDAEEEFGSSGVDQAKYRRIPGLEMLYDWSNPIKGSLSAYLATLTAQERTDQVKVLFGQQIATEFRDYYGKTLPSRIQLIRAAAAATNIEPQLISAVVLAEQRDQSKREDAADYKSATLAGRSSSIGLGQVTTRTAQKHDLFRDSVSPGLRAILTAPGKSGIVPKLLSSDEFNLFAVARYLRVVADIGAGKSLATMPNTKAWVAGIDLHLYAGHSQTWTEDHIKLIGSEYTSKPFDDTLVKGWGDFVLSAYRDVKTANIF